MTKSRVKEPMIFDGYVHDMKVGGFIVSTACEGPSSEICATDPAAKARADAFKAEHYGRPGSEARGEG
jgi:hypothetical protein